MADATIASVIPFEQPRPGADTALTQRPKTPAERAKAYRARKRAKGGLPAVIPAKFNAALNLPPLTLDVTPAAPVTTAESVVVRSDRTNFAPLALRLSALALAAVGITMNGWFARSLGSSDLSGWLFLALGVASDAAALVLPCIAAIQWQASRRLSAAAGWAVWLVVFAFAIMSAVGFSATSISDTVTARASRVTPQVVTAQNALSDAMRSRDAECKGGVGRFCREREAAVVEARHALDAASASLANGADPQVEAATRLVSWISAGSVRPTGDDLAMIRLALLALLPQVGGILLMVARRS